MRGRVRKCVLDVSECFPSIFFCALTRAVNVYVCSFLFFFNIERLHIMGYGRENYLDQFSQFGRGNIIRRNFSCFAYF